MNMIDRIEAIQKLARKDAESYDYPLVRYELGSEAQEIYDRAFEEAKEAVCQ
jgi:hypothetical protein